MSLDPCAIRLTFDAQRAPRNHAISQRSLLSLSIPKLRLAIKTLGAEPKCLPRVYSAEATTARGKEYTGRIVAQTPTTLTILLDSEDSTKVAEIKRGEIDEVKPSAVSLMPKDLLKPLNEDEVLDLLAYLLSRGDPNHPMFKKEPKPAEPKKARPKK